MQRRDFAKLLGLGAATIIVPQFGRFYREGVGRVFVPDKYELKVGRTIYVDCQSLGGDGSVERPFRSLSEALNHVSEDGTNIIMKVGHTEIVADRSKVLPGYDGIRSQRYFINAREAQWLSGIGS